jgi:hypothetical protein
VVRARVAATSCETETRRANSMRLILPEPADGLDGPGFPRSSVGSA